jgi:hypothetical protein
MKLVQRLFMAVGGLCAAAALLTLLSPKAHALAAALVEVANTRSTPVPNQDVDQPGRHPYSQTCQSTGAGGFYGCALPNVPANTEIVVQHVSILLSGGGAPAVASLVSTSGGQNVSGFLPLVAAGGPYFTASQPITQYMDAGTATTCFGPFGFTSFSCTVSGYTVSLP